MDEEMPSQWRIWKQALLKLWIRSKLRYAFASIELGKIAARIRKVESILYIEVQQHNHTNILAHTTLSTRKTRLQHDNITVREFQQRRRWIDLAQCEQ